MKKYFIAKNANDHLRLQQVIVVHQRSLIKDRHNKYNNNERVWNIARITKMWHRDKKWWVVGKMAPIDLLNAGLPQTFNLQKMQNLRSTIKQGMAVINKNVKGMVVELKP